MEEDGILVQHAAPDPSRRWRNFTRPQVEFYCQHLLSLHHAILPLLFLLPTAAGQPGAPSTSHPMARNSGEFIIWVYDARLQFIASPLTEERLVIHSNSSPRSSPQSVCTWYIGDFALSIMTFRNNDVLWGVLYLIYPVCLTVLFHFGVKLRAAIGRLPDEDIENFLENTLFKGGVTVLISNLFLTFRVSKCLFENDGDYSQCYNKSLCAVTISVYLSALWAMKMVDSSVPREWRGELR